MTSFNRPEIPQAVAQLLGIKGYNPIDFTPELSAQAVVADLVDSPYLRIAIPLARSVDVAAVAAEHGYVVAVPAFNVALQIQKIRITNSSAGALVHTLTFLAPANITTAGLATTTRFLDVSTGTFRNSALLSGTHTSILGSRIMQVSVPTLTTVEIDLPTPGLIISGSNVNEQQGGVGVCCNTQNIAVTDVAFIAREWPLPG